VQCLRRPNLTAIRINLSSDYAVFYSRICVPREELGGIRKKRFYEQSSTTYRDKTFFYICPKHSSGHVPFFGDQLVFSLCRTTRQLSRILFFFISLRSFRAVFSPTGRAYESILRSTLPPSSSFVPYNPEIFCTLPGEMPWPYFLIPRFFPCRNLHSPPTTPNSTVRKFIVCSEFLKTFSSF